MQPSPHSSNHTDRIARARLSLDGLSVGDAFGQQFFYREAWVVGPTFRQLPPSPWHYTDDTEMGLAIVTTLEACEAIDQDFLADAFARRYASDPGRGYGGTAHTILRAICHGTPWRQASQAAFDGAGSMGNGSAMRVAPVGAYFADDLDRVVEQARLSAEVTHLHPDGIAGAIAIAVAAAWAWNWNAAGRVEPTHGLFQAVLDRTPASPTRQGIEEAAAVPDDAWEHDAARRLGNGSGIVCRDTVPYCLWAAARNLDDYVEALWSTVIVGGDIDTTSAIVGGIVALSVGADGIPAEYHRAREPLS